MIEQDENDHHHARSLHGLVGGRRSTVEGQPSASNDDRVEVRDKITLRALQVHVAWLRTSHFGAYDRFRAAPDRQILLSRRRGIRPCTT